jgi:hypothetical protein
MKYIIKTVFLISLLLPKFVLAQEANTKDTVIVNFGEKSKIVFYINDKGDLESLEQYDLNAIAKDLKTKLEQSDSGQIEDNEDERFLKDADTSTDNDNLASTSQDQEKSDSSDTRRLIKKYGTRHFFNFDIGMNNYLENGVFPNDNNENYSVRPWGSWHLAIGTNYKSQILGKLFLEYGASVSWYNFKFENNDIRLEKTDIGTRFVLEGLTTDYVKSKLTTTHLNLSLVPTLDFGKKYSRNGNIWNRWDKDDDHDNYHRGFRIGIGGYAGYKLGSYAKYVVEKEGKKLKSKDRDGFYLNNWRYGARLQLGYRGTDIFFNYDISELFTEGKGPSLNTFSFGITL